MGITDFFSDVLSAVTTTTEAYADAPTKGGASTESPASGTDEEGDDEKEANEKDANTDDDEEEGSGDGGEDAGGDDEEEEEEEEEEELEDPKEKLEEECKTSKQCAGYKHHYDECAERVQQQQDDHGKADEDCVEEFFHLMHCASACAAPKLWAQLK